MRPWTDAELAVLAEHYGALGPSDPAWAALLPGRSRKAIAMKAHRAGMAENVPKPRWTGAEDEVTRRYFAAMAKRGHTPHACVERLRRLSR